MEAGCFHPGGREITRLAGERTGLAPGRRALDVGCGLGAFGVLIESGVRAHGAVDR